MEGTKTMYHSRLGPNGTAELSIDLCLEIAYEHM